MSAPKIFISYSHDSDAHRQQVLALSERLRADGLDADIDQYVNGAPLQGWPRWMLDQLDAANYVLVVCTETYYRRFRGHEVPGKGKGVDWEGAIITQEIYDSRSQTLKFVPILLSDAPTSCIPEPLRSVNHYRLDSEAAYQSLYDFLLNQAGVEPRPIGSLKPKSRPRGAPLTFGPTAAPQSFVGDISRILKYAPEHLIGREDELKLLGETWDKTAKGIKPRAHVLTFVALGGEGKTSLVAKWAATLADDNWPGCDAAFAWSFYSQGTRDQQAASSDLFLKEALTFFGDDADRAFAASPAGAYEKGQRLARIIGQRRSLLILDGLEPLQYAPTSPMPGQLKDQGIAALLKGLATVSQGLCVVTTRYSLPDLKAFRQTTAPEVPLLRLSPEAGIHLLQQLGVRKESGSKAEFEKLVEDVKGHALTLTLLGGFLKRAFHGDIRQRDRVKFEKADEKMDGGHAFRTMAAYEQWLLRDGGDEGRREVAVLRLMGLFDRPADAGCLAALRSESIGGLTEPIAGLNDPDWEFCISGLEAAKLLTVNRDEASAIASLDVHSLLREYFATKVRAKNLIGWRKANRRLYDHLCETKTDHKPNPSLEDLQPLYQAVTHGCQAGLQQEAWDKVYIDRITRREEKYVVRKLGAFGSDLDAVACFFDEPWKHVSPALREDDKSWVLNLAAFRLKALGRLTESAEPMRSATGLAAKLKDWRNAATGSSSLSKLELMLGEVARAVEDAEQSVIYADRSGDTDQRLKRRATVGDALVQAGRHEEGEMRFREAEHMQIQDQQTRPLL